MKPSQIENNKPLNSKEFVDALANGLAILRLFATGITVLTIQEVSEHLDITRAAARRLLLTLFNLGYVTQRGRQFSITPKVMDLGLAYFASMKLPALARPAMRALAQQVGHTCSLGVLDKESVVFIAREEPPSILRLDLSVGSRLPAYAHSLGRMLLSSLKQDELDHYLATVELKKLTPFTTTSKKDLLKSMRHAQQNGYCIVRNELVDGFSGIAVPVRAPAGDVIAGVGVSMVLGSHTEEDPLAALLPALYQTTSTIEASLVNFGT